MKPRENKYLMIIFIGIILIILSTGLIKTIISNVDTNYYENRVAYKMPKISLSKLLNKEFQDNVELAFSDQIPLSTYMKKGYNFFDGIVSNGVAKVAFKNNCKSRYFQLAKNVDTFDCDGNIVYRQVFVSSFKNQYDNRIIDINKTINDTDAKMFIYYIERDTDIDFETNNKSDIYDYLKENINSDKIYKFEINNFNEFKDYFYKTDHHWNYKGSYKAYKEIVNILTKDQPIKYQETFCMNVPFSGSKAAFSGAKYFYKEEFCAYKFNFPNYDIYINGEKNDYGLNDEYYNNRNIDISYGLYYGSDSGEVIFDNHNPKKQNILIIGESYDNALLKLIASHFNKTYSIDLRNYERENGKKIEYLKYMYENKIDVVLLIGSCDFFRSEDFNLEDE